MRRRRRGRGGGGGGGGHEYQNRGRNLIRLIAIILSFFNNIISAYVRERERERERGREPKGCREDVLGVSDLVKKKCNVCVG